MCGGLGERSDGAALLLSNWSEELLGQAANGNNIVMTFLIFFTVIYRQIFAIAYFEVALTLGFLFYFPPVSLLLIDNIL